MLDLDLTNLLPGQQASDSTLNARRKQAHESFEAFRAQKMSTFFELVAPEGRPYMDEILKAAQEIRSESRPRNFLNLGIGGSALGGEAVLRALLHPLQNDLPPSSMWMSRYFFPDNIDPETIAAVLQVLDPAETLVHIASKSGSTAETAAQMMIVLPWLEQKLGADGARKHVVVSTDPEKGDLRALVQRRGYRSIGIPPGVGGRFSVFGSVGLLPLALFGLDVEAFVDGAAQMAQRCRGVENNPALELALALHAQQIDSGRNLLVFMSYSDSLAPVGDWFGQLWAESLGKNKQSGTTPVRAVGATDQHSQLQLFMEGPDDKVILFLRSRQFRADITLPPLVPQQSSTAYLEGHTLTELLRVESLATEKALTDNGRPNAALILEKIDERSMGALLYFLQLVTVYAGGLYGVNPFDQPGVEAGKKFTYGYFGRPGFEAEGKALREYESRKRTIIKL